MRSNQRLAVVLALLCVLHIAAGATLLSPSERNSMAMLEAGLMTTSLLEDNDLSPAALTYSGTFDDVGWSAVLIGSEVGLNVDISFAGTYDHNSGTGDFTSAGLVGGEAFTGLGEWAFWDSSDSTQEGSWDSEITIGRAPTVWNDKHTDSSTTDWKEEAYHITKTWYYNTKDGVAETKPGGGTWQRTKTSVYPTASFSQFEAEVPDNWLIATGSFDFDQGIMEALLTVSPPIIKIEKTHNSLQGHYEFVSITLENYELDMGGFDFLIAYDASALTFMEATPGQLLEDCGWEYFTYRYGADGNCGDACPSGLLRIIAIADVNNGPNHPSCYGPPDTDPHELAEMKFLVTNDRTYECQYVPIRFFWGDCGDNAISSVDGELLYIDRAIYDFEGNLIWDEEDDDEFPEDERIPHVGAPNFCLNPDPDKPTAVRELIFVNGGIDIACADSIDARGDLNLNGIANEIADAVLYTNYFLYGIGVFDIAPEGQVAASDVNNDGTPLTVGDLVYLVRVITGDALPFAKLTPLTQKASVNAAVNHSAVAVFSDSPADLGAGLFVFDVSGYELGEPMLINGAAEMTLKHHVEGDQLRVLVYSFEQGKRIPAGVEAIFAIPISGEGAIELREVQLADYYGNLLTTRVEKEATLPSAFALHQNYPNPFNATTQIIYEIPEASQVKIEIFNTLGQKVRTLFDGEELAGVHGIEWDATDDSGNRVASGVFFYRITSGQYTQERKMVLLK